MLFFLYQPYSAYFLKNIKHYIMFYLLLGSIFLTPYVLILEVHTKWKNRLQEIEGNSSRFEAYCQQVKTCIEVASKCLKVDRHKRPNIQEILATLNETEMIRGMPSRQIEEVRAQNIDSILLV